MKDCNSRISWMGGEGPPSKDHTCQGEEREDTSASGFQLIESIGKGSIVHSFPYNIYECVHRRQWRQVCICNFS
jgi:hypothetical protein